MAAAYYTAYLPVYGYTLLTVDSLKYRRYAAHSFTLLKLFLKRFCDLPNNNIKLMPLFIIGVR